MRFSLLSDLSALPLIIISDKQMRYCCCHIWEDIFNAFFVQDRCWIMWNITAIGKTAFHLKRHSWTEHLDRHWQATCCWYLLLRQRISRKLRRMSIAHWEQCRVSQWKEGGLRSEIFSWRVKNFCSTWLNSIIMSAPAPYSLETRFIVFSTW